MNPEIVNDDDDDDEDLRALSDRLLPLTTSASYPNNISPRHSLPNRNRSLKPQKSISTDNQQIFYEDTSLPTNANTGDILQMNDGTRKKYNGSSWRRMCSKPNCSYYNQSQGLCKPHLAALKKRKLPKDISAIDQTRTEQDEPKKGDLITLSNGIRKKYDGRQYRRVCAYSDCTTVVHGSLEYQNGLCSHHYQEFRTKTIAQSSPSSDSERQVFSDSPSPAKQSVITSSSRKRHRPNSPSPLSSYETFFKSSVPKPSRRLSIAVIPASVDIEHPKKGDIIEMENGSRKKFDGVVWRTICSIPDCLIAAQRNELCRKHFIQLNGKPNSAPTMIETEKRVTSRENSTSSTDRKDLESQPTKDESMDSEHNEQEETNMDTISNSYDLSDDETHVKQEQFSPNDDHLGQQIDHTLINALSASREKFPTTLLKKWLREHRTHPYPSNQDKIQLAKQSSITFDQVTTWFNNARAILRRRQAKLRQSFDTAEDEEEEEDDHANKKHSESSEAHRSSTSFNGVCCRSVGVQCNPSTAEQSTLTSTQISMMTDEELTVDRTIRILSPSSRVRNGNGELLSERVTDESETKERIIVTSTCLDDEQMSRLKEFCSQFDIELSNIVDEHTTHLITDEEEGETLVCPLSKKVIQAVARHMYIVTYRWIDACFEAKRLINEKPFEIQGDLTLSSDHNGMQRSRQSVLSKTVGKNYLLENFSIMLKCDGCQEMMNNQELIELVRLSGAKHTSDSHFTRLQTGVTRVVLCEKEYLLNRREMYDKCVHAGIHFLTPEWFLESLVQYRIQPFQEYQISP